MNCTEPTLPSANESVSCVSIPYDLRSKILVVSGVSSPPMDKGLKPLVYILNVIIMVAVLAPRSTSVGKTSVKT